MQPVESFKHLGLAAVLVTYAVITFLFINWKGDKSQTISRNAHASKQTYYMMVVIESIVLPIFFLFIRNWFSPTFQMSQVFTTCVGGSSLGLLMAAYIPSIKGWKRKLHEFFAYTAFFLFIPTAVLLSQSPNVSPASTFLAYVAVAYLLFVLVATLWGRKLEKQVFFFQWGCMMAVHSAILAAVYIR